MSDPIIRVRGVSKQFRIGAARAPYKTLRETLTQVASRPIRTLRGDGRESSTLFWALNNVSFEVDRGEVIGLIGRNGSGKSTLLKVLSRITPPTRGRIELNGRVGSLLEVGTGFHPELTGRENVFLNGAILGMRKTEIQVKFDEIVAFAEVDKFVDTPVKHYSSGMYLRLAFAVAAYLESEILIVDEVLAVGDASFQKKCLARMGEVSRGGRTVIFVSHNMSAVQQLTSKCILLRHGEVEFVGKTQVAIEKYLADAADLATDIYEIGRNGRRLSGLSRKIEFVRLQLRGHVNKMLEADQDLSVFVTLRALHRVHGFGLSMTIFSGDGTAVGSTFSPSNLSIEDGITSTYEFRIEDLRLAPGNYYCGMGIVQGDHLGGLVQFDGILDVLYFEVLGPQREAGTKTRWDRSWGAIRFRQALTIELAASALTV